MQIYAGNFDINGERLSSEVLSWATTSSLHTGEPKSRLYLDLYLFNPALLALLNEATMSVGVRYVISGPRCASIQKGPLGHPGDGEYDRWNVDGIEFSYRYEHQNLHIAVAGSSNSGTSGLRQVAEALEPLSFSINFVVPNAELKSYLSLTDSAWGFFQETLSANQRAGNA